MQVMDTDLLFLNLDGLDAFQVTELRDLLHPSNFSPKIEFPWGNKDQFVKKGKVALNVHAPAFKTFIPLQSNTPHTHGEIQYTLESFSNGSHIFPVDNNYQTKEAICNLPSISNGLKHDNEYNTESSVNGQEMCTPVLSSKLNPTVSSFVPQRTYSQKLHSSSKPEIVQEVYEESSVPQINQNLTNDTCVENNIQSVEKNFKQGIEKDFKQSVEKDFKLSVEKNFKQSAEKNFKQSVEKSFKQSVEKSFKQSDEKNLKQSDEKNLKQTSVCSAITETSSIVPETEFRETVPRSWAQIVSSGQQSSDTPIKSYSENETKITENEILSVNEDKMALSLGKYLYELVLDFKTVCLQPRGLINRRNWCYINATLQALLASSPFYSLLRNLPLGPGVERGKSATPVIDSMVKVSYEFSQLDSEQEDLQVGQPFQPDFIYDMLSDLKSDCLKGQQEDAEEFLSFILNSMHEEMVKVIKNYEHKNCISYSDVNGNVSSGEEEWQVIGSKHKGMVTRKVAEHKTPISDLLGGQIKSFLTTSGSKTSASIQPFFTLQLDIQSENVTSVSEALKEMTVKEPIQGYTCAKTKQEVEAYSHISLQKLPPVLILHLKRFVYNKNGGCKKVMKKTDYPIELELSKDLFSPDIKKSQRMKMYRLFAVMYHDGEEAVKGHYISDVYNFGKQTWLRCDDRQITPVTESQVLSHSPPRVPYLLFYQES